MPAELPSGTVTLLFTDIEGSTRMLQELGRETYVRALTDHRRLLREAFTSHGGVEVEMQGDSFHFAFPYARDAVAAAVAGQRALAEHAWESQPIKVRIGLHTGEPMQADGLYAGFDVHWAARVMSAGHGGQSLVSHRTAELVQGELPSGVQLLDLGEHRLKDLTTAQRLYQIGAGDFPPLKSLNQTNLPVAGSSLIGREVELEQLLALLRDDVRLVTVTGTGGSGKTRLALQAAAEVVEEFRDGVFWVPLAGLGDPDLVLASVAQTLGARDELADHLAQREALLVLDNFEHVLAAAEPLADLLASAPNLKALVTSRSPLHLDGEHEFPLDPLGDQEAVTLFVERARGAGRRLEADETVATICNRLDNLPLALELAAARTKLLAPEALLARLEQRLPLLTGGRRDAPERQRTLTATIEWSYELLDPEARRLFARLSVFAGSFSLDAAEEICDADLDTLAALVDLSLLKPVGDDRFLMLETIREYAAGQLERTGGGEELRRRHAEWFARLGEEAAARALGPEDGAWLERIEREHENFRAALAWSIERGLSELAFRLVTGLGWLWYVHGHHREGREWITRTLSLPAPTDMSLLGKTLNNEANLAAEQGDLDGAEVSASAALRIFRDLGDKRRISRSLLNLAVTAASRGELPRARAFTEEAASIARDEGLTDELAVATLNLGDLDLSEGSYERAESLSREARWLFKETGASTGGAGASLTLALALLLRGHADLAAAEVGEAIALSSELGWIEGLARAFDVLAAVLEQSAHPCPAARLLGAAEALRGEAGVQRESSFEEGRAAETLERLRAQLGERRLVSEQAAGRALDLKEAVDYALAQIREEELGTSET